MSETLWRRVFRDILVSRVEGKRGGPEKLHLWSHRLFMREDLRKAVVTRLKAYQDCVSIEVPSAYCHQRSKACNLERTFVSINQFYPPAPQSLLARFPPSVIQHQGRSPLSLSFVLMAAWWVSSTWLIWSIFVSPCH